MWYLLSSLILLSTTNEFPYWQLIAVWTLKIFNILRFRCLLAYSILAKDLLQHNLFRNLCTCANLIVGFYGIE